MTWVKVCSVTSSTSLVRYGGGPWRAFGAHVAACAGMPFVVYVGKHGGNHLYLDGPS